MPKLNQIIAVVNGKKSEAERAKTEIYRKCTVETLFNGQIRKYTPKDEDGDVFPDENKPVVYTVDQAVAEFRDVFVGLADVIATQDYANGVAKADVLVDGKVVLEKVPVTYLLFLEKQLTDIATFMGKLPVLDVAESWTSDSNRNAYVSEVSFTNKTKKDIKHKILVEATDKHPAQVKEWSEDVVIGKWDTSKLSGAIPARDKKALVEKVKKLQDAVKFAREAANSVEVEQVKVGDKIFDYLLG